MGEGKSVYENWRQERDRERGMWRICWFRDVARLTVAVPVVALALGCTNAQMYDVVQSHQEMKCLDQPAAAIQDCLDAARVPYADYEREALEVMITPHDSASARESEHETDGAHADG